MNERTEKDFASHDSRGNKIQANEIKFEPHMYDGTSQNFQEAYPDVLNNPPNPAFAQMKPARSLLEKGNFEFPPAFSHVQPSDQIAELYPVVSKGSNYRKYCTGWLAEHEKPTSIRDCIWKYTSGNWFCSKINMALGTDSPKLEEYGEYIKHLKYSIGMSPMQFTGTVFRGADMSSQEISAYESKNFFFIPSFTSTSKIQPFQKNTLFHVEISPEWAKFCVDITRELTAYPNEDEILLSCYNIYQYIRTEKSNGQTIIKLRLINYEQHFDSHTNTILS